jgi:hypothetical protein
MNAVSCRHSSVQAAVPRDDKGCVQYPDDLMWRRDNTTTKLDVFRLSKGRFTT